MYYRTSSVLAIIVIIAIVILIGTIWGIKMVDLVTGVSIGLILLIPVIIGWAYGKRLEEKRRQKEEEQKQKEEERKKKNSWDYKVQGLPKEEDNDKP